ncbi:IS110 family transposase [Gracilibacillus salinarum]|uniref:IS110 family transposase n=1 Tax=Gracilibacillus salinarum TaxID=2932255 RepID=A0ABY4GLF9_9BACI|nr:IS110 family transposase [Gracilibacillus salinarum]UOQ85210.1 IS110 family transposase [Gracilibacillus salinarum]
MKYNTKYVGLDVSKEKIAVAVADEGRSKPRYIGMIDYTVGAIDKIMKKLGESAELQVCYEAGAVGYGLYRLLTHLDIPCEVIAPSLIPQKPGDKVKTDKRDALNLATLYRAGELTPIFVPTEDDEALRDLVRGREDVKEDEKRAKHRVNHFLLRNGRKEPEGVRKWSVRYWEWLHTLTFKRLTSRSIFQEYVQQLRESQQRLKRLEKIIKEEAENGVHAPMIQKLMSLRGVALITATSLVAEVGSFERFQKASQFMAYTGLVPMESSSGYIRKQGNITRTGNRHVRRLLIEAAWSYRYSPAVKGELAKRQKGQPANVTTISWNAQQRLHKKYFRLMQRGKESGKVITAIGRELAGFIWAIANEPTNEFT